MTQSDQNLAYQMKNQWIAQLNIRRCGARGSWMRETEREQQYRCGQQEPGDGPGNSDVKQDSPRAQGRADANKGAECSDQRGEWDKERQRGRDIVLHAINVVAQLVRQK